MPIQPGSYLKSPVFTSSRNCDSASITLDYIRIRRAKSTQGYSRRGPLHISMNCVHLISIIDIADDEPLGEKSQQNSSIGRDQLDIRDMFIYDYGLS